MSPAKVYGFKIQYILPYIFSGILVIKLSINFIFRKKRCEFFTFYLSSHLLLLFIPIHTSYVDVELLRIEPNPMRKKNFAYLQNDKEFLLEIFTSAASNRLFTNSILSLHENLFSLDKKEKKGTKWMKNRLHTRSARYTQIHFNSF